MTRLFLSLIAISLLFGCGSKENPPSKSDSVQKSSEEPSNQCGIVANTLEKVGIEKLKAGLDRAVAEIPEADVQDLIFGTKVYRRADQSKYSREEIISGQEKALKALNRMGETLFRLELAGGTASVDAEKGTMYAKNWYYPKLPPEKVNDSLTLGEQYDGISTYGLEVGTSVADAGYALFAEIRTRIADTSYVLNLYYTAVTKRYVIQGRAWQGLSSSELFGLEKCLSDERIKKWTKMRREQENMNECEYGGCENLPKDD